MCAHMGMSENRGKTIDGVHMRVDSDTVDLTICEKGHRGENS